MKKTAAKKIASDVNSILSVAKPARKKERFEVVCDLVDCWIDDEITKDELVEKLMKIVNKPLIKISEMEYIVSEWIGNVDLECRATCVDGIRDNWVQVEDLTDFTVGEYNSLVEELHKHYPDYPIEYLEGRFV